MEAQQIINVLFTIAGALSGIVLKAIWSALESMRLDLAILQRSLGDIYVRKDDYRDHTDRVERLLTRIEAKLDAKEDKHS